MLETGSAELTNSLERAATERDLDEIPSFPYETVVASGMRSGMDYWAKLAVERAEELEPPSDVVALAARKLTEATWASQRVRQRARRLARRGAG